MNFNSLSKNKINQKLRITEPSVLFIDLKPENFIQHVIKSDEIGRPDLVANQYNNINLTDHILKINRISNPFAIQQDEILIIPTEINKGLKKWQSIIPNNGENPIRDQFLNTKKQNQIDQRRVDFINKKAQLKKNSVSQSLPPNILREDETNVNFRNGNLSI